MAYGSLKTKTDWCGSCHGMVPGVFSPFCCIITLQATGSGILVNFQREGRGGEKGV
jgi:hypothetical protein